LAQGQTVQFPVYKESVPPKSKSVRGIRKIRGNKLYGPKKLIMPSYGGAVENFESDVDKSLKTLKDQGLTIGPSHVSAHGEHVYSIAGYLLNADQILMLRDEGKLTLQGIKAFDISERDLVEKDILNVRKQIPEELKNWTAGRICSYINEEYERNHSVGQITAVLSRLGIEHA
jgi:hypothetical protein